jgi:hypothetical protein
MILLSQEAASDIERVREQHERDANSLPLSPCGRGWGASQTSLRSLRKLDCVCESEARAG